MKYIRIAVNPRVDLMYAGIWPADEETQDKLAEEFGLAWCRAAVRIGKLWGYEVEAIATADGSTLVTSTPAPSIYDHATMEQLLWHEAHAAVIVDEETWTVEEVQS